MKKLYLNLRVRTQHYIIVTVLFLIIIPCISNAQIVTYANATTPATQGSQTQIATNVNATLTSTTLTRVNFTSGGTVCNGGMSNFGMTTSGSLNTTSTSYITFSVFPNAGYQLSVTDFAAGVRSSTDGPTSAAVYYSTDGGTTWVTNSTFTPSSSGCQLASNGLGNWNMSDFVANSTTGVIFRIYGWAALSTLGNFQLFNVQVNGTVCPIPTTPVVSLTQPTLCTSTGTITITSPAPAAGITYSINGSTYTNTTGIFTSVASGSYNVTAKNSCGTGVVSAITNVTINGIPNADTLKQIGFASVITPKYMADDNSNSGKNRLPVFFRATLSGLCPGSSYRYYVEASCGPTLNTNEGNDFLKTNNGAGNPMLISSTGTRFTYSSGGALTGTNTGNYDTLTADASGNYTGWFGFVNTGNGRFTPGNVVYPTISLGNISSGAQVALRALDSSITVLQFANTAGVNNGSGIWGASFENDKNFVFLYNNTSGTGRPLSSTCVENDGTSIGTSVAPFYSTTNVDTKSSLWGTIIPNTLPTGVQRIEFRRFDGNITYAVTDNDGKWVNGAVTTINSIVGAPGINIASTATKVFQEGFIVYNGESSNSTTSLNFPAPSALTITTGGNLTINTGAKLAIGTGGAANLLTIQGTSTVAGTGTLIGSSTSNISVTGSGALGTLYFDQTTLNTSNNINTFTFNRSGGTATLGNNLVVSSSLIMTAGALVLNGTTLTANGTISGIGTLTGSTTSNLILGGTTGGSIGTLLFTSGNRLLNNLTLNRTGTASSATMGTDLQTNGACALTSGKLLINGNTLTLNGTYTSGASNAGSLTGSATSNLVIGSSATSIPLTFTYDALKNTNSLKTFTVNASASLANGTTSSRLYIVGGTSVSPGTITVAGAATTFTTNDSLVLQSNATGTARIDQNATGRNNYIVGKTTVERFFPAHRSWRLVTAPVNTTGAPTINASWQEGYANVNRTAPQYSNNLDSIYGTIITRSNSATSNGLGGTIDGYDDGSTTNPSLLYYTGNSWLTPAATTGTTAGANAGIITDQPGYMLFVRGNRHYYVAGVEVPATTTTLRVKGLVNQGTQNITGTGLKIIGNPYASSIYYDGIYSRGTNIPSYYYIWDPLMTGSNLVGSFITLKQTAAHTYSATPDPNASISPINLNPHIVALDGSIQSCEAFFTYYNNGSVAASGSSTITESDKTSQNTDLAFRPVVPVTTTEDNTQQFSTNLFAINNDSTTSLEDGVLELYNNTYSDSVNFLEDAPKLGNMIETLSILRGGHSLSIESRKLIGITDTVYYNLSGMRQKPYVLQFITKGLNHPGLSGFVIDSFLHTRTPLNMNGSTTVPFSVTSNTASSAARRFTVLFVPIAGGPLPVTFISIKATKQSNTIAVQWTVQNQLNIQQYQIEKSTDGLHFIKVDTMNAVGNNTSAIAYNWIDKNAVSGENYYRVISIGNDGVSSYSKIANVNIVATLNDGITVYPNPIKDDIINLKFSNQPAGMYNIVLLNAIGQEVIRTTINHSDADNIPQIKATGLLAKGIYQLQVTEEKNATNRFIISVSKQ